MEENSMIDNEDTGVIQDSNEFIVDFLELGDACVFNTQPSTSLANKSTLTISLNWDNFLLATGEKTSFQLSHRAFYPGLNDVLNVYMHNVIETYTTSPRVELYYKLKTSDK